MSLSKPVFLLCAAILIVSGSFFFPRWEKTDGEAQLSWDAGGYYWYLPSAFIYHDLKGQGFKDSIMQRYQPTPPNDFQYAYLEDSGNYVIRYTMGTALMESPFFFIAHLLAKPFGYPADGFSLPYQFMIWAGGIFFAIIGLWYLRKLLLYYFSDTVTSLALLLLVVGTNYLNYAGIDTGMTHTWLFSLYVFLLLNTHYYYQTSKRKYALRIGFLIGMMGLIRPPELISILIPLLWGMESISLTAIKERVRFFGLQRNTLFFSAIICLLLLFLQGAYWKYATGKWLVYTYRDQGFVWLSPLFKQYALNFQCGWLLYTPVMFLALIGIVPFIKSGKNRVAILALIIVNYYVVASWKAWDYGGRAMIQNYPVLIFPLAALLQYIVKTRRRWLIATPVLLLFTYFNIWWTYQAHRGTLIGTVPANSAYYFATIFHYNLPIDIQKLRDNKDMYRDEVKQPYLIYKNDLDTLDLSKRTVAGDKQFSVSFAVPGKPYKWIRAGADIHIEQKEWNVWYMTQFILRLKKGGQILQENYIRVQRLLNPGEIRHITIDARIRHEDYDHIELLFKNENSGTTTAEVSHLRVIGFNN